jgi:hypothetical protein
MRSFLKILVCIFLVAPLSAVKAQPNINGWSTPRSIAVNWYTNPAINADATRVVFLDPFTTSGSGSYADYYYDRQVFISEYLNATWSAPVLIANNAMNRGTGMMPVTTRPIISANGLTLAYLGCTGNCKPISEGDSYDIYVSRRGPSGWSTPIALPIDFAAIDERISLSADGNIIAFSSDYMNLPFYAYNQVYISEFVGGAWGAPYPISSNALNGWAPDLSQDGLQAVWLSNPSGLTGNLTLMYAHRAPGGPWSAPQQLNTGLAETSQQGVYRFSPDGNSLFYWEILVDTSSSPAVYSGQDLFMLRHSEDGWSQRSKVTATPFTPMKGDGEAPPAISSDGTRVIYPRTVVQNEMVTGTFLEMTEFKLGKWSKPVAITSSSFPYYAYPNLSVDGAKLISLGPDLSTGSGALVWMSSTPVMNKLLFIPRVSH